MAAIEENLTSLQSDCSKAVVSAASVASISRAAAEFEGLSPMCVLHFSRHCGGFHIGLPLRTGSYFRNKSGSKWQCQRPWLTFERDVPLRYRRTDRHIHRHIPIHVAHSIQSILLPTPVSRCNPIHQATRRRRKPTPPRTWLRNPLPGSSTDKDLRFLVEAPLTFASTLHSSAAHLHSDPVQQLQSSPSSL